MNSMKMSYICFCLPPASGSCTNE